MKLQTKMHYIDNLVAIDFSESHSTVKKHDKLYYSFFTLIISDTLLTLTLHHAYPLCVPEQKSWTLEWLDSEKNDPRNPKVPLTWSIKYGSQWFFITQLY